MMFFVHPGHLAVECLQWGNPPYTYSLLESGCEALQKRVSRQDVELTQITPFSTMIFYPVGWQTIGLPTTDLHAGSPTHLVQDTRHPAQPGGGFYPPLFRIEWLRIPRRRGSARCCTYNSE
jgi:hypothetical protein